MNRCCLFLGVGYEILCRVFYILIACERIEQDTIRGVLIQAGMIYTIYMWMYVCLNSSTCYIYVIWAELGHSHFYK